jgi:hypothetical protein
VCVLLERWPTLEELQRVPTARLRAFFRKHHCPDQKLIERRMVGVEQAIPAIRDRAMIEAKSNSGESDRAIDPQSAPGYSGSGPEGRGSGGGASGLFHL